MPTSFCESILKIWSSLAMTKGTLSFNTEWILVDLGDWSIFGRVLEIKEPINFEELIKKTIKTKIATQELPVGFSEALSRARVLADPESQKTSLTVSKGRLKLSTETHMGEVKDDLIFKGHPDVVASVNAAHLQRAISYCDQAAFHDNCTVLEKAPDVLQLVSNM